MPSLRVSKGVTPAAGVINSPAKSLCALLYSAKGKYMFTCGGGRYCLLALHGSMGLQVRTGCHSGTTIA